MKTINLLPEMLKPYSKCIIDSGIMVINNTAVIFELDENVFTIDLIVTDPEHRGKGESRFVLEHICDQADSTNTILELIPDSTFNTSGFIDKKSYRNIFYKMATKGKKLSTNNLIKYYSRLGFIKDESSIKMVRIPKK